MAIGERVSRLEDPPLLRGEGRFAADIVVAGCLHMRVVRSRVAHGRLRGVDTGRALELEGVVATFTASDFPDLRIGPRGAIPAEAEPYLQPVLARDHVRYVGEPVAIVIAQRRGAGRRWCRCRAARDRGIAGGLGFCRASLALADGWS